jgi:hypothetical protein
MAVGSSRGCWIVKAFGPLDPFEANGTTFALLLDVLEWPFDHSHAVNTPQTFLSMSNSHPVDRTEIA